MLPGVVPTGRAGAVVPLPTAGVAVRVVLTWGALTWVGPTWVVRRRVLPGVVPTGRAGAVVPLPTAGVAVRVVLTWGALTWVGPTWVVRRRVLPGVAPTGRAEAEPEPPRWVRQAGPTAVLEMVHPGAGRAVVAETEIRQADRLHLPQPVDCS